MDSEKKSDQSREIAMAVASEIENRTYQAIMEKTMAQQLDGTQKFLKGNIQKPTLKEA